MRSTKRTKKLLSVLVPLLTTMLVPSIGASGNVGLAGRLSTPIITETPVEVRVLQPIAQGFGCPLHIGVYETLVSFNCATSAGHSVGAQIERFSSPEAAYAAFTNTGTFTETFHGYPAKSSQHSQSQLLYEYHSWQTSYWIFSATAANDTHFGAHAKDISEGVYQNALTQDLFSTHPSTLFLTLIRR
jgi:hypothetical protein